MKEHRKGREEGGKEKSSERKIGESSPCSEALCSGESGLQVIQEVVDVFDSNAETNEIFGQGTLLSDLGWDRGVRHAAGHA